MPAISRHYIAHLRGTETKFAVTSTSRHFAMRQARALARTWAKGHTVISLRRDDEAYKHAGYLVTALPFCGFYESTFSHMLDSDADQTAENEVEKQDEEGIHPDLHLDASEFSNILSDCSDHSSVEQEIAADYVDSFSWKMSDELELYRHNNRRWRMQDVIGLGFETMTSPKEYNFSTDRVFAFIHPIIVDWLMACSVTDGHKRLSKYLEDNCTSYSGFHSHYSNELNDWIDKPVQDWDHNELNGLLQSVLRAKVSRLKDFINDVEYGLLEHSYEYHDNAVDWAKFERLVAEAREAKAEEKREDDPDYVTPEPRCHLTADLFAGAQAA